MISAIVASMIVDVLQVCLSQSANMIVAIVQVWFSPFYKINCLISP